MDNFSDACRLAERFSLKELRHELKIMPNWVYAETDFDERFWYWYNDIVKEAIKVRKLDDEILRWANPRDATNQQTTAAREDFDIIEVVSYYTELKGSNELMGKCPLHDSRFGSNFEVNPEKQLFHCFSCGKGGDVVKFIIEMECLTPGQAIAFLKNRYSTIYRYSTKANGDYYDSVETTTG
ncbi:hypothetical protein LCGC14_0431230 [marine sediment metagenome]|uniref:Zinc finger CHC2-type domain-containing protein n=1 Tax=marine sediment metagenome TaxID=412755 RepID=A0A0F9VXK4_9ZZZZ